MRKPISGAVLFAMGVAAVVVSLKVLNWVPSAVQRDFLREYKDIEEAKGAAGLAKVLVPAYYSQDMKFPPSRILAQGRPYTAFLMEFQGRESRDVVLEISQAASGNFESGGRLRMETVRERTRYALKGRDALLEVGTGRGESPRARISWREGAHFIRVTAKAAPDELIRIAESMLP